jgi:DNA-binding NarL/FixJ family response regulator
MGAVISLCLAGAVALAPSANWAAFVVLSQLFWLLPQGWAITATVVFAPGPPALAAAAAITAQHPGTCVVVLTTYDTDADILRAVEAGAAGYLYKDCSQAELTSAIRAAARGETVLTPSVAARLVSRMRGPQLDSLSPREVEVLGLVAIGRTNAEIGRELPSPRPR